MDLPGKQRGGGTWKYYTGPLQVEGVNGSVLTVGAYNPTRQSIDLTIKLGDATQFVTSGPNNITVPAKKDNSTTARRSPLREKGGGCSSSACPGSRGAGVGRR